MKQTILIELILSRACNKRCSYCDLDFNSDVIEARQLDMLSEAIKKESENYEFHINFFWGEPLLAFDALRYFVEKNPGIVSKYSLGTNGLLLDAEKMEFLKRHDVDIYVSIDNITLGKWVDSELLRRYPWNLYINFINDPEFLVYSKWVFDVIKAYKNVHFMPVFSTKKWTRKAIGELKSLVEYVLHDDNSVRFFPYFNWFSPEKQFIFDTDGYFYQDIDSLLWLQKQYDCVNEDLSRAIDKSTRLLALNETFSFNNLLSLYNVKKIVELIFEIPKSQWYVQDYAIIDKIFADGTKKRKRIWV